MSEIDGLIDLLINSFKRSKNLPYTIRTNLCPTKKKNCGRHHGEVVIQSYNPETNKFHCINYGVHIPKSVFEYDQSEDIIRNTIEKSLKKLRHAKKPLVTVKELKKIIKMGQKSTKNIRITFRCTEEERRIIRSSAKSHGLSEMSDYIKLKVLS